MLADMGFWVASSLLVLGGLWLLFSGVFGGSAPQLGGGVALLTLGGALRFAARRRQ